uniref:fructose-bisphosphate aldolase n=2 Tax=Aegilops tauschii subsp. strangulata TaxID=200361 RepID=A0A453N3L0_AEGTS
FLSSFKEYSSWLAGRRWSGTRSWLALHGDVPTRKSASCRPHVPDGAVKDIVVLTADDLQKVVASPGRGILAIDELSATCGKRLASIGLDNMEVNRQAYRWQDLCWHLEGPEYHAPYQG